MSKGIDLSMYKTVSKNILNSSDKKEKKADIPISLNKFKIKDKKENVIKKMGRPTLFEEKLEKQISVKFSLRVYDLIKKKANGMPITSYARMLILKDLGEI